CFQWLAAEIPGGCNSQPHSRPLEGREVPEHESRLFKGLRGIFRAAIPAAPSNIMHNSHVKIPEPHLRDDSPEIGNPVKDSRPAWSLRPFMASRGARQPIHATLSVEQKGNNTLARLARRICCPIRQIRLAPQGWAYQIHTNCPPRR